MLVERSQLFVSTRGQQIRIRGLVSFRLSTKASDIVLKDVIICWSHVHKHAAGYSSRVSYAHIE